MPEVLVEQSSASGGSKEATPGIPSGPPVTYTKTQLVRLLGRSKGRKSGVRKKGGVGGGQSGEGDGQTVEGGEGGTRIPAEGEATIVADEAGTGEITTSQGDQAPAEGMEGLGLEERYQGIVAGNLDTLLGTGGLGTPRVRRKRP